jgi:two-component SAPR family response regulator
MDKLGVLLIDKEDNAGLEEEITLKDLDLIKNIEVVHEPKKAVDFLKKECSISDKGKCPEFVIIDLGMSSPDTINFFEILKNINLARQMKIQVILLFDKKNETEINKVNGLGIDCIRKPLTKKALQEIFERNERFKNLDEFF